jgi:glutathione S-transferase
MAVAASKRSVMTLYSNPKSAYSHRVRVVLAEKSITVDIVEADPQDLPDDGKEVAAARKQLRDSLVRSAPIFAAKPFFMSDELGLVDCSILPLLWRLPALGVELPGQAKPIQDYAERMFKREAFVNSLTEAERELRG